MISLTEACTEEHGKNHTIVWLHSTLYRPEIAKSINVRLILASFPLRSINYYYAHSLTVRRRLFTDSNSTRPLVETNRHIGEILTETPCNQDSHSPAILCRAGLFFLLLDPITLFTCYCWCLGLFAFKAHPKWRRRLKLAIILVILRWLVLSWSLASSASLHASVRPLLPDPDPACRSNPSLPLGWSIQTRRVSGISGRGKLFVFWCY